MWGYDLMKSYPDYIEFVGLCDKNEGRVETGKKIIGASCPTYTDFEKMMKGTRPDVLIVTTMDSTHHHFIIRGMELGADIITEKPMTTDEKKIQAILHIVRKYGNYSVPVRLAISLLLIFIGIWTLLMAPIIFVVGIVW